MLLFMQEKKKAENMNVDLRSLSFSFVSYILTFTFRLPFFTPNQTDS